MNLRFHDGHQKQAETEVEPGRKAGHEQPPRSRDRERFSLRRSHGAGSARDAFFGICSSAISFNLRSVLIRRTSCGRTVSQCSTVPASRSTDPRQLFPRKHGDHALAADQRPQCDHAGMTRPRPRRSSRRYCPSGWARITSTSRSASSAEPRRSAFPRWRHTAGRGPASRKRPDLARGRELALRRASTPTLEAAASSFSVLETPPRVGSRMQRIAGTGLEHRTRQVGQAGRCRFPEPSRIRCPRAPT